MQLLRTLAIKDRGVGCHTESAALGSLDRAYGYLEDTLAIDQFIMPLLQAIDVNAEGKIPGWSKPVEILLEKNRIRAEIDKALALNHAPRNNIDLGVHERLAACYRDYRCTTLFGSVETLLGRHVAFEDIGRILDFPAAHTGEITAKEWLEHEHQWIAFL